MNTNNSQGTNIHPEVLADTALEEFTTTPAETVLTPSTADDCVLPRNMA
jgi:hypothetical protein